MSYERREADNQFSPSAGTAPESAAAAAWANECAGWLALGRSPEAEGLYVIGRSENLIWARPDQKAPRGLPVMLLVERALPDAESQLRAAVERFAVPRDAGLRQPAARRGTGRVAGGGSAARFSPREHSAAHDVPAVPAAPGGGARPAPRGGSRLGP